jgi:hypothetical protein
MTTLSSSIRNCGGSQNSPSSKLSVIFKQKSQHLEREKNISEGGEAFDGFFFFFAASLSFNDNNPSWGSLDLQRIGTQ